MENQLRESGNGRRRLRVLPVIGFAILALLLTIIIVGFLTARSYDDDASTLAGLLAQNGRTFSTPLEFD